MKTKIFPTFLIFTFLIIFFVFFKGLQNTNIYTPETKSEIKIPNFDTKEFFSKDKINSDQIFIGSDYYLLNIWASWCIPCKEEHKYLMDLSKKENIKIIGQNYKDNFDNAKNFLINLDNPNYQYMIGGQWVSHPGGKVDFKVNFLDDELTEGLNDFEINSEQWYVHYDPNIEVVANTRFTYDFDSWIDGVVMPVAWKKMFDKGKVFYISVGHDPMEFEKYPDAWKLLTRGFIWAARD